MNRPTCKTPEVSFLLRRTQAPPTYKTVWIQHVINTHWSQWHAESFEFPITVLEWTDVGINHFHYEGAFKTNEPIEEEGQRGGAVEPHTFSLQSCPCCSLRPSGPGQRRLLCADGVVGLVEVTSDPAG